MIKCESFKSISGETTSILLFGIIHSVRPYTEKAAEQAIKDGLSYYCSAIDNNGNIYKLFSDYDPCLQVSNTIAFKTTEGTNNEQ